MILLIRYLFENRTSSPANKKASLVEAFLLARGVAERTSPVRLARTALWFAAGRGGNAVRGLERQAKDARCVKRAHHPATPAKSCKPLKKWLFFFINQAVKLVRVPPCKKSLSRQFTRTNNYDFSCFSIN